MAIVIQVVILLGLGAIVLVGALVAFRAERNWATTCLLAGTIVMAIGWTCGAALGVWMSYHLSSANPSGADLIATIALVARVIGAVGVLCACAGFIGLVFRFAVIERRAGELEVLSAQIQDRFAAQSSAAPSPRG